MCHIFGCNVLERTSTEHNTVQETRCTRGCVVIATLVSMFGIHLVILLSSALFVCVIEVFYRISNACGSGADRIRGPVYRRVVGDDYEFQSLVLSRPVNPTPC